MPLVGVTSRLDLFYVNLCIMLGARPGKLERVNSSNSTKIPSTKTIDLILELNKMDLELYKIAEDRAP